MKYLQKLFLNSMKDICSDIIKIELNTGKCYYIYAEDGQMEEQVIPFGWNEVKQILIDSVYEKERKQVSDKWNACVNKEVKEGASCTITYHSNESLKGKENPLRTIYVSVFETEGRKTVFIFNKEDRGNAQSRVSLKIRAEQDGMTHLYNRIKLDFMLENSYTDMEACGVLFFNLNELREINRKWGREAGDKAICKAAESLWDLQNENVTAYRYTGDKFLVIAKNYTKDQIRHLIDLWVQNWNRICALEETLCPISIGVAWDSTPVSVLELIAKANTEMHRNKELMKAGVPLDYYVYGEISCSYGLRSRKQFFDMVDYRLEREAGEYCLVAIDIEHFKLFNKWYGRKAGDEFLESFAEVLRKYETEYKGIASYFGGDDFVILLPKQEGRLEQLAGELIAIAQGKSDSVGFLPELGVYSCSEKSSARAIEMYDYAVEASSHVEGNFENRICCYDKEMTSKAENVMRILSEAKDGLEQGQFVIYLQPKCRIKSRQVVGAEALVRWKHPVKGLVPPSVFVPILEENGFISDLDHYVWELVCKQIRSWLDNGIEPVAVSINVSRIDMLSMNVVEVLNGLVRKYAIDKKYLKIEITESAYVENGTRIVESIQNLRKSGFSLMMDDFGSGYSSLNMLRQITVDVIKVDMKFMEMNKEDQEKGLVILKSIINMANEINVPLIVEGVETEEQTAFLGELGVDFAQGYLFYRPMPVESFTSLISEEDNVDRRGIFRKNQVQA